MRYIRTSAYLSRSVGKANIATRCAVIDKPKSEQFWVGTNGRFTVGTNNDPSGGWSRHIWDHYGPAIADCAMEAKRTDRAVKCSLDVRKP